MTIERIAERFTGLSPSGHVLVLDVAHSVEKYRPRLGEGADRQVFFLRPPEGSSAITLKAILDEEGGTDALTFRYYAQKELDSPLKPVLESDPFAKKHFMGRDDHGMLKLEGMREAARHNLEALIQLLHTRFDSADFPHADEFEYESSKRPTDHQEALLVIAIASRNSNRLRLIEPEIHTYIAECNLAREVDVHRPTTKGFEHQLQLTASFPTTADGARFLEELENYLRAPHEIIREVPAAQERSAGRDGGTIRPRLEPIAPKVNPPEHGQLLQAAAQGIIETLPTMPSFRKSEPKLMGAQVEVQLPRSLLWLILGNLPGSYLREVSAVVTSLKGDPALGHGWWAHYRTQGGRLTIAPSESASPPEGWKAIKG